MSTAFYQQIIFPGCLLLLMMCSQKDTTESPANSTSENVYHNTFSLQAGDILFQDSDCGPFCDAIEKVTFGVQKSKLSHNGLVVKNRDRQLVVLEAISAGVVETPIDTFLNRSFDAKGQPKVIVGRLKRDYQHLIEAAVDSAYLRLGKAYDEVFDIANDKYYCSELIYYAFKEANRGKPIFQLRPMTFNDPDTQQAFSIWVDYFKKLGVAIPEGQPGLNPGSMSRSFYLDIVHEYGELEKVD